MVRYAFVSGAVSVLGSLLLTGCPSNSYECPTGQYYDAQTEQCYAGGGYGQQCPPGSVMGPQGCMPQQGMQCPQGQVFNGQTCVAQTGQCPQGQQWNGQTCAPAM